MVNTFITLSSMARSKALPSLVVMPDAIVLGCFMFLLLTTWKRPWGCGVEVKLRAGEGWLQVG